MSRIVCFSVCVLIVAAVFAVLSSVDKETSLGVVISEMYALFPIFKVKLKDYLYQVSAPTDTLAESEYGRLLSPTELKGYKGEYLAILGEVFDVRSGQRHYGKDGGYHFFTGRDGTRAFATGDFTEKGLVDDISGLGDADILAIDDYSQMYHRDYIYVGRLIGNFYDKNGKPTESRKIYEQMLLKALEHKRQETSDLQLFPPCNSEFRNTGSRVWCTKMSGGISRDWAGVPRKYFKPGASDYRCACIPTTGPPTSMHIVAYHNNRGDLDNPNFKVYEGCDPLADSCAIQKS